MPLDALALVVFAGLIHACWNIAAKKAGGDARFACFTALVLMVFWAPVGLWLGWQQVPAWGRWEWGFVVASLLVSFDGARLGTPVCRSCAGGRPPVDPDRTTADNSGTGASAVGASPFIGAPIEWSTFRWQGWVSFR